VVEKEREKDLGKVVTGGGEGTEKANHGGHGEKQTTEGTEDTERGRGGGRGLEVERAVVRATPPVLAAVGVSNSPTAAERVALPARPPAWQAWRRAPQGAEV